MLSPQLLKLLRDWRRASRPHVLLFHRAVHQLLAAAESAPRRQRAEAAKNILPTRRCSCCGGRMIITETFEGARPTKSPLPCRIRIDTS
jgi:hypothetical protein